MSLGLRFGLLPVLAIQALRSASLRQKVSAWVGSRELRARSDQGSLKGFFQGSFKGSLKGITRIVSGTCAWGFGSDIFAPGIPKQPRWVERLRLQRSNTCALVQEFIDLMEH